MRARHAGLGKFSRAPDSALPPHKLGGEATVSADIQKALAPTTDAAPHRAAIGAAKHATLVEEFAKANGYYPEPGDPDSLPFYKALSTVLRENYLDADPYEYDAAAEAEEMRKTAGLGRNPLSRALDLATRIYGKGPEGKLQDIPLAELKRIHSDPSTWLDAHAVSEGGYDADPSDPTASSLHARGDSFFGVPRRGLSQHDASNAVDHRNPGSNY